MRRSTVMLWHSLRFMNAGAAAPMAAASLQLLQSSSMHAFHALCQEPTKQQPICNAAAVALTCSRTTSTTPSSTLARQLHSCKHGSCAKAGPRNTWAYSSSASSDESSPASDERQQTGQDASTSSGPQPLARLERRVAMVFTCGKCDTRAVKTFSRSSYERGLVLVRCPGCQHQHLIADHLGWFGDKGFQVEQLAEEKGTRVVRLDAASAASAGGLQPEDLVGWSKVQQLVEQFKKLQSTPPTETSGPGAGAGTGTGETSASHSGASSSGVADAGVAGVSSGRQGESGSGRSGAEGERGNAGAGGAVGGQPAGGGSLEEDGVVEVSSEEAQAWRKVRAAGVSTSSGAGANSKQEGW